MTVKQALLAATILTMPLAGMGAAQAQQPINGLYVGAGAGVNFRPDAEGNRGFKGKFEDVGGVGLASIGYGFGNGLRAEVEGNYRFNEIERITFGPRTTRSSGGYFRNYGAMGNVLYDFVGLGIPVVPYVGVGAGAVVSELDDVKGTFTGTFGGVPNSTVSGRFKNNTWDFAYQGIVGVAYALDAVVPGLALTAEYRFFGTLGTDAEFRPGRGTPTPQSQSLKVDSIDNYNHSILLGIRYAFGAVAPAPVVAPPTAQPPATARTYLVFFDWDRSDLTERARQIVAEAAGGSRRVQTTRIEVSGHADRSGTPQYNQALSQRRANTVAAELVRLGIARTEITIQAFGESRPLVPTADGVREPQNRRVEIVLR